MPVNRKVLTLCLIVSEGRVNLGLKKRGFGAGRFNGYGGKVEPGETIQEAAIREVREECGVEVKDLEQRGKIDFEFTNKPDEVLEVNIFKVLKYEGEPVETEEMAAKWFPLDQIPFDQMWPDDAHWFPLFLADKNFTGRFLFGDNDVILKHELNLR